MQRIIIIIITLLIVSGCSTIIPSFMPAQKGKLCSKPECLEADQYFWDNLHAGNYDSIPQVLFRLKAVYLENPQDWKLAAHIGFTHTWALTERSRIDNQSPAVTDHATLAVKYFEEALQLCPEKEWRYYGFYATMLMTDGGIHGDMKRATSGYFKLKKAVRKYPEFNLFTAAYTSMNSPRKKDRAAALGMLWENIDKCVGEKVDRKSFDFRKYFHLKDTESKKSTCWNTWIAPHNLEGFLLVLGDLELRSGNFPTALNVYKNATYITEFKHWAYQEVLLSRIEETEKAIENSMQVKDIKLMKYDGCMVCHQEKNLPTPSDAHLKRPPMDISLYLKQ